MSKNDMVNVMLNHCQLLNVRAFSDLTQFASGIEKGNSYKNGYQYEGMPFQKEGTTYPEWDYKEAIIRYCLSSLRFIDKDVLPKLPFPDYVRGLKKRSDITNKSLKEHFGKHNEWVDPTSFDKIIECIDRHGNDKGTKLDKVTLITCRNIVKGVQNGDF